MKDHQLWLDTINLNIQAGKTLQEALLCADALSAREFSSKALRGWPFKYVNGEQTPDSEALQDNKAAHYAPQRKICDTFDPSTCEESPL